jgi:hypothetical protein
MKELKVVGQVLAAIVYTCIFTEMLKDHRGGEHHGSHSSGQEAVQVLPLDPFGGKPGGMTKRKTLQLVGFQVKGFCYGSP